MDLMEKPSFLSWLEFYFIKKISLNFAKNKIILNLVRKSDHIHSTTICFVWILRWALLIDISTSFFITMKYFM